MQLQSAPNGPLSRQATKSSDALYRSGKRLMLLNNDQALVDVDAKDLPLGSETRKLDVITAHWQFGEMLEADVSRYPASPCVEVRPAAVAIVLGFTAAGRKCLILVIVSTFRVRCSVAGGARLFDAQGR
jgi:hypothetical protein